MPRATPAADRERQATDDDQQRLCESGSVDGRRFTCRYGYVFPQPARSTGPTGCTPCNSFNVFPARAEPNLKGADETNRRLMVLSEEDRRSVLLRILALAKEHCVKITRTFYQ